MIGAPFGNRHQCFPQVSLSARVSLDLAAGSLGHRTGSQEGNSVQGQFVITSDGTTNGVHDHRPLVARAAFHLAHDNQPARLSIFQRKRRCGAQSQSRMGLLDGQLDIMGIVVDTPQDDQVLDPARDEQLTIRLKSQVAGSQVTPAVVFRQTCLEDFS